jgi:hypothetical protein
MATAKPQHLHLVQPRKAPEALSILDERFLPRLEAFNQLTRDMRAAGIVAVGMDVQDQCLVIEEEHVDLLTRRFAHEIRSSRSKSILESRMTRHTVTIRGVDVVWFTVVKEQLA